MLIWERKCLAMSVLSCTRSGACAGVSYAASAQPDDRFCIYLERLGLVGDEVFGFLQRRLDSIYYRYWHLTAFVFPSPAF